MPKRGFKKRIWNKVCGLFSLRGAKHRLAVRSELKEPNCYQQKETDQNTMHCLMSSATTPHNKPRGIRFSKRAVQRSKYLRQKLGVRKTVMGFSPRVGSITEEDENEITLWMLAENAENVISDGMSWLRDVEESYGDDAGMDQERHEEILQMWIESNSFDRLGDDEDSDNSDGNSDEQHDNYCSDIEDDDDEQDRTHDDDDYDDDDPTYQDDSVDNSKKQHCGDDDDDDEQDRTHGDNDFDDDPINQDASDDNNEKQHCNDDDDDDNAISQDDSNDNSDERYGMCFNSNNDGQSSHDVSDKRKQHKSSDYDDDDCDDDEDSEDKQSESSSTNDNDEYTTYSTNNGDIILSKRENDNKLSRNFNEINNVADKDCHDYFLKTKLNSDGNNDVSGEKNTLANSSDLCSAVETTRSCNVDKGLRHDCTRKDILDSPSENLKLSLDNCNSIGIGNMSMSFELDLNVSEKISSDPKYCDDDEYDDHDECNYDDGDAQADNISNSSDVKATKKSNMNSELDDDDDHGNNNYPTIHNNTFTNVTKTETTKQSYHDVDIDDDNDDDNDDDDGNDDDDSISNSSHNFSTKDDIKDSILKDSLNSNSLNHKIHGNQATSTSEKLDHNHNKEGKIKSKINEEDNTICNDPVLCAVKEEIDGILNRISNIASDFSLMKKTMNEMKASDAMNSTKT